MTDAVNKFLAENRVGDNTPLMILASGRVLSVQASANHYCSPKDNEGPYSLVEVLVEQGGAPAEFDGLSSDEGLYSFVPVRLVNAVIASNGGILTDRMNEIDFERLGDLIAGYDQRARVGGFEPKQDGSGFYDGVTPQDCGGFNGSDHSYRLTKLVKLGLAEHRKGPTWGKASTRYKGAKKYRPSDLGRLVWKVASGMGRV